MPYEVKIYGSASTPMNYRERQKQANKDGCAFYVEQHFNASENRLANYGMVIVGHNASKKSIVVGEAYLELCSLTRGLILIKDKIPRKIKKGERGDKNLRYTSMPAMLLEPLFCSNLGQAVFLKSDQGQRTLIQVLVDTIKLEFPARDDETVLIGFSVGHKYKRSRPNDRGAPVYGGGWEADYAEIVLEKAKVLLEKKSTNLCKDTISQKQKKLVEVFFHDWQRLEGKK